MKLSRPSFHISLSYTHTQTLTLSLSLTHSPTHSHTPTHTHTNTQHTHTHTNTHTHTPTGVIAGGRVSEAIRRDPQENQTKQEKEARTQAQQVLQSELGTCILYGHKFDTIHYTDRYILTLYMYSTRQTQGIKQTCFTRGANAFHA